MKHCQKSDGGDCNQKFVDLRFYERWNEEVITSVSPDNLLVFDVRCNLICLVFNIHSIISNSV